MQEAKTKVQKFGLRGMHIYIPADVRKDSLNPLTIGDEVMVSVDGEKMMIVPVYAAKQKTDTHSPSFGRTTND